MSPSTHFPTESDGGGQKNVKNPLTKDTEYGIIIIERGRQRFGISLLQTKGTSGITLLQTKERSSQNFKKYQKGVDKIH